ncbi:hypothetical protein, partial [Variovorax sp.]|uniref:hypothetical protein n=1 Tax=Variovorax sp. TaxID=1871043 RepID=UPI0025F7571B
GEERRRLRRVAAVEDACRAPLTLPSLAIPRFTRLCACSEGRADGSLTFNELLALRGRRTTVADQAVPGAH